MNIKQSYLTTIMKGSFSLYEIRVFVKIVEHANKLINKKRISSLLGQSICVDGITCNLAIPISEIAQGSHHTSEIKEACKNMLDKKICFYNRDTKTWHLATIIQDVRIKDGDSLVRFTIPKWLLEYILDFVAAGFSMYDLQSALSLPSAYAVRFYWLTCSMSTPCNYSVRLLRQMLGVPDDKYDRVKDFIKRCVERPRQLLEKENLNGFSYSLIRHGRTVTAIHIVPVKRQDPSKSQLTARAGLSAWCSTPLRQYLQMQCEFTPHELAANKSTLLEFQKIDNWQDLIVKINERARRKRAGKAYIMGSIKAVNQESKETGPIAER